jgi:protein-tyrosine phosphatase
VALLTDTVHAWRSADGRHHLSWEVAEAGVEVSVRVLSDPDTPALRETTADAGPARISLPALAPNTRHRFQVSDGLGNDVTVATRGLGFAGTDNFRDFGGYPTHSGKTVAWGRLFRSGALSGLTDEDVARLSELGIALVCDFRRRGEQKREPSRLPGAPHTPRVVSLPMSPGSQASAIYSEIATSGREGMIEFMVAINREFALAQHERFAEMFAAILEDRPRGLLIHCAAGKDRTGFAAALILAALGVPQSMILRDYLLTREYYNPWHELPRVRERFGVQGLSEEVLVPMLDVDAAYLGAALGAITDQFGGMDAYLESQLGVGEAERRELAALYLEG